MGSQRVRYDSVTITLPCTPHRSIKTYKDLKGTMDNNTIVIVNVVVQSVSCQPCGLQHSRLPYPSLSPWVCSNSCPLSWQCHRTIPSSVTPLSSCPQSFPALGSFPMSWLFAVSGQSIGASAFASVLLMNIQCWFPLGLTGLISLQSKRLSRAFSRFKNISSLVFSLIYGATLTSVHDHWKNHSFNYMHLCW